MLTGAPAVQVQRLGEYGLHLGLAFQAVDDILGIWGEGDPHQTETPMKTSGQFVDLKAGYRYKRLAGGGHWMPLDRPAAVTDLLLKWFPK